MSGGNCNEKRKAFIEAVAKKLELEGVFLSPYKDIKINEYVIQETLYALEDEVEYIQNHKEAILIILTILRSGRGMHKIKEESLGRIKQGI